MPTSTAGERRSNCGSTPCLAATFSKKVSASASLSVTRTSQWLIDSVTSPGARPAAAIPSRTHESFSATRSSARSATESAPRAPARSDATMLTMSASRPARRSTRGLPPPRSMGGWGRCTGAGTFDAAVDPIVAPVVMHRVRPEEGLDDMHRLLEPSHPDTGGVERDPGHLIVGSKPARAQAEREAAFRDDVKGGRHSVHEHRVAVVVAEHSGLEAQPRSGHRRRRQRHHWLNVPALGEMVGDDNGVEAGILDLAQLVPPGGHRGQPGRGDGEAEHCSSIADSCIIYLHN